MGWGFVVKCLALYLGFRVLDLFFALFPLSDTLANAITLTYAAGALAYMASSFLLAAKIVLGRGSPSI